MFPPDSHTAILYRYNSCTMASFSPLHCNAYWPSKCWQNGTLTLGHWNQYIQIQSANTDFTSVEYFFCFGSTISQIWPNTGKAMYGQMSIYVSVEEPYCHEHLYFLLQSCAHYGHQNLRAPNVGILLLNVSLSLHHFSQLGLRVLPHTVFSLKQASLCTLPFSQWLLEIGISPQWPVRISSKYNGWTLFFPLCSWFDLWSFWADVCLNVACLVSSAPEIWTALGHSAGETWPTLVSTQSSKTDNGHFLVKIVHHIHFYTYIHYIIEFTTVVLFLQCLTLQKVSVRNASNQPRTLLFLFAASEHTAWMTGKHHMQRRDMEEQKYTVPLWFKARSTLLPPHVREYTVQRNQHKSLSKL